MNISSVRFKGSKSDSTRIEFLKELNRGNSSNGAAIIAREGDEFGEAKKGIVQNHWVRTNQKILKDLKDRYFSNTTNQGNM